MLERIINKYTIPREEKTSEWHKQKRIIVGSSELYTIKTDFKTFERTKLQGKGCRKVSTNSSAFGIIFENVAKQYLIKSKKIDEIGELWCIQYNDKEVPLGASPDGIFESNSKIKCLEIKCPMTRKINDYINTWTSYQIQAQLMCIPESTEALFAEFQFRVCNKHQFETTAYNRRLHTGPKKYNPYVKNCICKGVIEYPDDKKIDIGKGVWDIIENRVELHLERYFNKPRVYHSFINEMPYIGSSSYLCWHLDKVEYTTVRPDPFRQKDIIRLCSDVRVKDILSKIHL